MCRIAHTVSVFNVSGGDEWTTRSPKDRGSGTRRHVNPCLYHSEMCDRGHIMTTLHLHDLIRRRGIIGLKVSFIMLLWGLYEIREHLARCLTHRKCSINTVVLDRRPVFQTEMRAHCGQMPAGPSVSFPTGQLEKSVKPREEAQM